ncbi:hypothetical protein N0V90_004807 [Kalmusia sp. IMI 367209]|nr:hypothetical protein N0V90_004807 [Kalmusia sp. IMI 367209]
MPPQKEKLSKGGLKELMESFSIKFEGPVSPNSWPPLYSHHFKAIRDIWSVRYDDYMKRTDIDAQRKAKQQRRVVRLRENAYSLRQDLSNNESTWRDLVEPNVIKIFGEQVIWFVKTVPFVEMNNIYQTMSLYRMAVVQRKL